MNLAPGTRLGPYEIVAPLGAGGMGEVWLARDTRLDRRVAIKVLPSSFADDEQLRARFEREARAISQLSHPRICALYDVGNVDGHAYLVMEYLEGDTLASRIDRGPLPFDQVIRYGVEICDALDRAHSTGIVHRDLKPANVMLTRSGIKLLDFGLAKQSAPAVDSDAATVDEAGLTRDGAILGTLMYMAPEQLRGEPLDARADIFAAGGRFAARAKPPPSRPSCTTSRPRSRHSLQTCRRNLLRSCAAAWRRTETTGGTAPATSRTNCSTPRGRPCPPQHPGHPHEDGCHGP